jgi:putative heme iron utilization protein
LGPWNEDLKRMNSLDLKKEVEDIYPEIHSPYFIGMVTHGLHNLTVNLDLQLSIKVTVVKVVTVVIKKIKESINV